MGSLMDFVMGGGPTDSNRGGQGQDAIWNGYQWVPRHIAAPGTSTSTDNDWRSTPLADRVPGQRPRQRTSDNPYGMPEGQLPQASPTQSVDQVIRSSYGHLAGFVNHPEVGPILKQAANEGWDEARLYGAVSSTDWWKKTSAAQRTWWQLTNEDPAEAARKVNQTAATIKNRAESLGVNVNVAALAHTATANGWTDAQTVDAIIEQINWANLESGDLTAIRDDVMAVGSDYLVGVSAQTAQNYAAKIASGEMSMEGVRSAMQKQAKGRFGYLADQLDGGMTVKDYFRPVQDVIARELGVTTEEIDLTDSKWMSMIEKRDEKGGLRAATLDEAMLTARRDPKFANTAKAKEMSTSMAGMVTDIFGRR